MHGSWTYRSLHPTPARDQFSSWQPEYQRDVTVQQFVKAKNKGHLVSIL